MKSSNRIFGLDIARLLAMLMMVQGHTVYCLLNNVIVDSQDTFWQIWTFIRGFTAPVFLMVSGFVHIFVNKRNENGRLTTTIILKRLNVCFVLLLIGYLFQLPAQNIFYIPFLSQPILTSFLKVNILQLFSISLLSLILLFIITKTNKSIAIISFIIGNGLIFLSHFLLQINYQNVSLPMAVIQYLTFDYDSIFPVMPFAGYLYLGVAFGYLLLNIPQEKRNRYILTKFTLFGLVYLVLGLLLSYYYSHGGYKVLGICKLNIGISVYRVGISLLVIVFGTLISSKLLRFERIITILSNRSLFIYVIHLILIYGTAITPGIRNFFYNVDTFTAFYCAVVVILFSILLVLLYEYTYKKPYIKYLYRYLIVAILIYMLLM